MIVIRRGHKVLRSKVKANAILRAQREIDSGFESISPQRQRLSIRFYHFLAKIPPWRRVIKGRAVKFSELLSIHNKIIQNGRLE
jgi:hypothetical protein